jgi:hypothetical protein
MLETGDKGKKEMRHNIRMGTISCLPRAIHDRNKKKNKPQ